MEPQPRPKVEGSPLAGDFSAGRMGKNHPAGIQKIRLFNYK
jgi:hypothetical protein